MCFRVDEHGVVLLDAVEKGLPKLVHLFCGNLPEAGTWKKSDDRSGYHVGDAVVGK